MNAAKFLILAGLAVLDPIYGAPEDLTAQGPTLRYLTQRKSQQLGTAEKEKGVFTGFEFNDLGPESGVRFVHHMVDDAGKNYKAAHYDHGNGVAVADVDGDGRLDVYFTSQLGRNELWRNVGKGKFEDITEKAGVALTDQISVTASFGDLNNDGLPDLFVTTVRHGNHLFQNLGEGRFRNISEAAGIGYSGHSSGIVLFDFDRDGLLDIFVTNVGVYTSSDKGAGGYFVAFADAFSGHLFPERTEFSILYRNLGGMKFADVSKELGLRDGSWSGDATFTDLNQDGYADLYLVNMQGDNHYYENQAGKGFVDKTPQFFPKTPWGAMGVKFFDYNRDARPDLFLTDMHSDMTRQQTEQALGWGMQIEKRKSEAYCSAQWSEQYLQGASNNIFGNAFYENKGNGKFEEVSDRLNVETYWPWGMSVGDLNGDGFEDIFVTAGMGYPFRYAINSVLLNASGKKFMDAEFLLGIEPRRGGRVSKEAFVLDCSGSDKTNELCAGKSGRVSIPGTLSSRSSAIFDLDDDGDLDIITLDLNDRPQILISNLSEKHRNHYLKVKLRGEKSNRDGLGATVTMRSGTQVWMQYHDGKSGYLAQSSMPLYFGLGTTETVDSIEVKWPSGTTQLVERPAIDTLIEIREKTVQ